ncbi:hypothetical protein L9F63_007689, partial [Diploptera punctata]
SGSKKQERLDSKVRRVQNTSKWKKCFAQLGHLVIKEEAEHRLKTKYECYFLQSLKVIRKCFALIY